MRTRNITVSYKEYISSEELDAGEKTLLVAAMDAAKNSYAPYSGFRVGAALLLTNGTIVKGTNVENAAFPSGICAERSAISSSVSNYPNDKPVSIAIVAFTESGLTDEPVTPCGNCRQVIAEEEARCGNPIKIILSGKNKTLVIDSIGTILPLQFSNLSLRPGHP